MKSRLIYFFCPISVIFLWGWLAGVCAQVPQVPVVDPHEALIRKTWAERLPDASLDRLQKSTIPGWYEILSESQLLYMSADGRYLFLGDVMDVQNQRKNITESRRQEIRLDSLVPFKKNMILFSPKEPIRHTLTVFTDLDCGYCRTFHQEIQTLLGAGVQLRYLAFPRAGVGSPSYEKAVRVWCDDHPVDALTQAMQASEEHPAGKQVAEKPLSQIPQLCQKRVSEAYELGKRLGVKGTPTLILETGQLIPGYIPATQLVEWLEHQKG